MSTRRIVFTKNNWTEEDYRALMEEPLFSYLIIGKEIGEKGTPHLQGYAEFTKKAKYGALAKKYKMHCEVSRGTQDEAIKYCMKDGDYAEKGTKKLDGASAEKNRWEQARVSAKEGRLDDVPADIYIRCYRTLKEIAKDNMPKPESLTELKNLWIYGPAGSGKTRLADAIVPISYSKNCNKWWDGYQNEPGVIINDVGKEHSVLGHHFKLWGEHRPFIAETKGGAIHIRPQRVIITSQYSLTQIWEDEETRDALARRYKVLHLLGNLDLEDIDRISKDYA
ncbi:replication associated protein [Lake Sarah-associated circular molecule 2]|uniref:replication associated protein n=1 Tax=Lake Sarah-associated circular molecule 2 TaxID=1685727 RepID=UPI0007776C30|nr:replication associated protein [Lake Sarah-associated circular molecule 2]ALE29538.1 replication associated protein [Lake Sarah-associated circular molecule 2]